MRKYHGLLNYYWNLDLNSFYRSLKTENTIVRCGEYDADNIHERLPHQDQKVKHISIHPAFNMKNLYYDVALVHTETNFALDEHIQPICLPDPTSPQPSSGDKPCYTMGYGKDGYGK